MAKWNPAANEIFLQAVEIDAPELRKGYVDDACGGDAELRAEVESLLDAREQVGDFLERPAASLETIAGLPSEILPGTQVGRYKLLEEIGEGGFGVVYMAEQREPVRRKVALKVIKPGMDTRQVIARFEAERQALAMMDHPNIARVFDGGATESGRPYFVMELVHGIPITQYCDEALLTTDQRLELFISVCDAVHHAHQKGIIHRDLKPSNLLVTLHGETPVPKVIDFGVAKATGQQLTEKTVFTGFGEMIGTPLYMSPEQMVLSGLDIDVRSDIYSLGVLLYELLSGVPPFDPQRLRDLSLEEIRRVIREEEPPKPSTRFSTVGESAVTLAECRKLEPAKLTQTLRGELDWIVMRALEKDRNRRYESAHDFAKDLQRYLDDEPVQACPPSKAYRFKKFVRRNRSKVMVAAAMTLSVVATLVLAAVMFAVAFRNEKVLRHEAQDSQRRAEESELEARRTAYASDILLASRAWRDGDFRQFAQLLDQQRPTGKTPDLRGFEWHYLQQQLRAGNTELTDSRGAVYSVCMSPDGRSFAAAGEDATLRIYDTSTCGLRADIETGQEEINAVAFSPNGRTIATAGDDGTACIWEIAASQEVLRFKATSSELYNTLFTPDGETLITCGRESVIRLWDAQTGDPRGELAGHDDAVEAIAISPDGKLLGSIGSDCRVILWDLRSKAKIRELLGHENRLSSIAFSPDGKWVATGGLDKTVRVWDVNTGAMVTILHHLDAVQCLSFDSEGRWLAAGDRGGVIHMWPESNWTLPDWSFGSEGQVRWCGISPDGVTVAAITWERVLLRNLQTHEIRELKLADPSILKKSPDGDPYNIGDISSSGNRLACLTEIYEKDPSSPTGWKLKTSLKEDPRELSSLAFSPDGGTLATGGKHGSISLWDVESGECRVKLDAHDDWVLVIAYAPDGRQFATASKDGRLIVWDADGKPEATFEHPDTVSAVAFSPAERLLVSGCWDGRIRTWDLKSNEEVHGFGQRTSAVTTLGFSPDGGQLASTDDYRFGRTVRVWDVKSRQLRRAFLSSANIVAFLPNGKAVMAGGAADTIRFWNLDRDSSRDDEGSRTLRWHEGRVYSITQAAHGKQWISAGQDGKVVVSDPTSFSTETELKLPAHDLAFASGGRELALAGGGFTCLVDVATGSPTMTIPTADRDWYSVAAHPAENLVAFGSRDKVIAIWDRRTKQTKINRIVVSDAIGGRDLAFSPDGTKLAACTWGETFDGVQLFDTTTGALLDRFPADACHFSAFSPDGRQLVVDSQNDLLVWDVAGRRLVKTLRGHTSTIRVAAFSPDGRLIASAGNDRIVRLWDAGNGEMRCAMQGHRADVLSLAFTPDGRSLATSDEGGSLKLWHVATGRELMTLIDEGISIDKITFSPDGKHLAYVRGDYVVRLIHVPKYAFHPRTGGRPHRDQPPNGGPAPDDR